MPFRCWKINVCIPLWTIMLVDMHILYQQVLWSLKNESAKENCAACEGFIAYAICPIILTHPCIDLHCFKVMRTTWRL